MLAGSCTALSSILLTAQPAPAPAAGAIADEPSASWGTALEAPGERGGNRRAGRVMDIVEAGPLVILAGDFTGVVPPGELDGPNRVERAYLAALETATGALAQWSPAPNGPVRAIALSPDGRRLYVGGHFTRIGGQPARNLAALDVATGALDPGFSPPRINSEVRALALAGSRLYIGGNFTEIEQPDGAVVRRPQLAALDAAGGALLADWKPPANGGGEYYGQTGLKSSSGDGTVDDLAVSADLAQLYVAGTFLDLGGQSALLSLDTATAEPTAWQPRIDRPTFGIDVRPGMAGLLYAATGGPGGRLYAFETGGSTKPWWEVKVDGDAVDVAVSTTTAYLMGHYDFIVSAESDCYQYCPGGPERHHLAAFDADNGELTPWGPTANTSTGPYTAALGAGVLYVGGEFTRINTRPQPGIALFPGMP